MPEAKGVWVFGEVEKSDFKRISLEAICEGYRLAQALNEPLSVILAGGGMETAEKTLPKYGCSTLYAFDCNSIPFWDVDSYLTILVELIQLHSPRVALFGTTSLGSELAARSAARLKVGVVTDCSELKMQGGVFVVSRPSHCGKLRSTFCYSERTPFIASVASGYCHVGQAAREQSMEIVRLSARTNESDRRRVEFVSYAEGDPASVDLTEADTIVAVGRGLGDKSNLNLITELANVLGASVGASRAAVDLGWVTQERQIGMTGKTVMPRLFLSCGISGQHAHRLGMENSGTIVAINTDRNAPIFGFADLCIVGDLREVVPAIVKRFQEATTGEKVSR